MGTSAKSCPRNIHRDIANAYDGNGLAYVARPRIHEIVNSEIYIAASLPFNAQGPRTPRACSHKHGIIAITQQIVDLKRAPNRGCSTHLDPKGYKKLAVVLNIAIGKSKVRNPVLKNATNPWLLLKNRDLTSCQGKLYCNNYARRARTDDCRAMPVWRCL